jgi:prepilin-type N-terminal cleavage/methylation domain-containing protein
MLTSPPTLTSPLARLRSSETGFTLIELLVAMVAGLVVMGALYTILEVSLAQSTKIANETYADQLGRTAMTKIVDELHNACMSSEVTPIQSDEKAGEVDKSSATKLVFVNTISGNPVPAAGETYKHEIVWAAEPGSTTSGTLTDQVRAGTAGTWPKISAWSAAKEEQLATHITRRVVSGTTKPIFTYFKYAATSSEASGALEEISLAKETGEELSEKSATETAAVEVNFNAGATNANSSLERSIALSDRVTFAFSAPNQETPIKDAPCQ